MSKRVYISADYLQYNGDRDVVEELQKWGNDSLHKVDFIDMSSVAAGSVASDPDCRICDLKAEFNRQINASSAVIFVVGDKTRSRTAGQCCARAFLETCYGVYCTPYKQNSSGEKPCKVVNTFPTQNNNVGNINSYSYLRHEFEQAVSRKKDIIIVYNSTRYEHDWLPAYMKGYEDVASIFWTINAIGQRIGNYMYVKKVLGFE